MKQSLFFLFPCFLLASCGNNNDEESTAPENNVDAARSFIQAALEGKFNDARNYLLADSINTNYLDVVERSYQRLDSAARAGYRNATLRILRVEPVNDSVSVIIFSNSFKNDPDTLKVLRIDNKWLVDLKYLYLHSEDTTLKKSVVKDTLQ